MLKLLVAVMTSLGAMLILIAPVAQSQDYPAKPIRIITSGAGGSSDFSARLIAQGIAGPLGQPAIVDNRVAIVAIESVAKAVPDGYTLLCYGNLIWLAQFMRDNVAWDGMRDFSPIIFATTEPNILVVHPLLPVKTVKELIALAKARPGALNYASVATGGPAHLAAELFNSMARVNIVRIPYKSAPAATTDMMSGQVQLSFAAAASVAGAVKSGRLRAVAVTIQQPSTLFPGVPTVAASGLPGFEAGTVTGIFAPAKTSLAIVNRLNREMALALNRPEVKEKFASAGQEIVGGSPEEFAAAIRAETARMGKVIKDAGIRDQ